jgi:hypothetical protein
VVGFGDSIAFGIVLFFFTIALQRIYPKGVGRFARFSLRPAGQEQFWRIFFQN